MVSWVARLPTRVQTKLLIAFLSIVGLLIVLGAVGLQMLSGVNNQTNELIRLQRKIAAYHQVQHDTTNQLYSISTALLLQDDRMLDAALRQLGQFGYDLDRMEFVAKEELQILSQVRQDYERFTSDVNHVVSLVRAGRTDEARKAQMNTIVPFADRLERLTNQLVNMAEADMVAAIDKARGAYGTSRLIVASFAIGSILLALGLGYIISWSLIEPVKTIEERLRQIASGEFARQVTVVNRDELGVLAANVNQTSEQLGRLYQEIEARNRELTVALEQQTATSEILRVISTSPTDPQPVFDTIVRNAVALCGSLFANVFRFDGELLHFVASQNVGPDYVELLKTKYPMRPDSSQVSGRAVLSKSVALIEDALGDPDYDQRFPAAMGWRRMLGVPMLRKEEPLGVIVVGWAEPGPVLKGQEDLLRTFADQAVIAIENVRLFQEVQARTAELARSVGELEALGEVSQAVNSTLDLDTVLKTIVAKAVQLSGTDAGVHLCVQQYPPTVSSPRYLWDERRSHRRAVQPADRTGRSRHRRRRAQARADSDAGSQ